MTFRTLISRSLRYHARSHLGVVLGAAVGSAALVGALVVGDSVRGSLHDLALARLGKVELAMASGDHLFRSQLGGNIIAAALQLPGTATTGDDSARANHVQILGVNPSFWHLANQPPAFDTIAADSVILNQPLAQQLKAKTGDTVLLRVQKPSLLSRDAPISPQDDLSIALRLKVQAVVTDDQFGRFSLQASQVAPFNAFVNLQTLDEKIGQTNRANLLLLPNFLREETADWNVPTAYGIIYDEPPLDPLAGLKIPYVFLSSSHNIPDTLRHPSSIPEIYREYQAMKNPQAPIFVVNDFLRWSWQLSDAQLQLRALPDNAGTELRSSRIFMDPPIVQAALSLTNYTNAALLSPSPGGPQRAEREAPLGKPTGGGLGKPLGRGEGGPSINQSGPNSPIPNSALRTPHSALTYFVNSLSSGTNSTPYSMVTAICAPIVPPEMRDDEILINQWLADDLHAARGDSISLTYFVIGNGRALEERTNNFRIHAVVPIAGPYADRGLMPDFPGIAEAESQSDWDAGLPINFKNIRPKDEQYWKQYRGTPKAFITLSAGQKMWANRFGDCTAVRFPASAGNIETIRSNLLRKIDPASVGLSFQPVREQALAASSQAVDFGGLFIGFSFFLIIAALLLMGLLFQFGLEQRAKEIGTLLALGFRPKQVRRLFLGEGIALAAIGGVIGALGGILYAKAMLYGLATIWRNAVGTSALRYHATPETLIMGTFASAIVGAFTIWVTLRKQARRPARELLAQGAEDNGLITKHRSWGLWIGSISTLLALGTIGSAVWGGEKASPDTFFSAGALLLIAGLGFCATCLARLVRPINHQLTTLSTGLLGWRSCGRRRKRSLATIGLLSCGVFLIVAIGAFRIDANQQAFERSSGTGGFALLGETALPVTYDLNSTAGREFYGLTHPKIKDVRAVQFRVHEGDEASCLNLNHATTPRLLGVNPDELVQRHAFTFAEIQKGLPADQGWALLKTASNSSPSPGGEGRGEGEASVNQNGSNSSIPNSALRTPHSALEEVPAIGDENSILWAMGKKIGDTVDYTDSQGRPFKIRLVGALANSVLQGNLIIDENEFIKKFPDESGYRMFLFDAPSNNVSEIAAQVTRSLRDVGLELTPAADRLNAFNAVQNTYLSTFQVLGGLGLLLGSAGLGVVVLRNVQERRSELALLLAIGFRKRALQWLVLSEHGALLGLSLAVGIIAAVIGVLPALISPGAQIPFASLGLTLATVLLNGLVWAWLATKFALRGKLLDSLRNE